MKRTQQILAAVLIVQALLVAWVYWPKNTPAASGEPLFTDLTTDQIVALTIDDDQGNHVELARNGDSWVLPNADDYAIQSDKIDPVLENILAMKTGRLVARNETSFPQLKVGENDFLRRVWFKDSNNKEYIFYVGTLAGAGATHVRRADQNDVYLTDTLSSYDLGSQPKSWIDINYVAIPTDQMEGMMFQNANGTFEFAKTSDDVWSMKGLEGDEQFNQNNLMSMLTRLSGLQMSEPLGKTDKPEYGMDNPSAVITVLYQPTDGDEQTLVLTIGAQNPDDSSYVAYSDQSGYYVTVAGYTVQDFIDRDKTNFLVQEPTATPEATATP
jgi:hypothetical protein